MKIEARPWKPQDLLDDLQEIIDEEPDSYMNTRRTTLCMALDYLKDHFAERANAPLTLDELREMDGDPVFVNLDNGYWGIVDCKESVIAMPGHGILPFAVSRGRIYRRKPGDGRK